MRIRGRRWTRIRGRRGACPPPPEPPASGIGPSRTWRCGSRGACPPPPEPPASGKVPVPGKGRRRARGRVSESRGNTNGSSRFFAERPLRISAPLRRCRAGANSRGRVRLRERSMDRRYGERRATKCRFLSPEPLSFRPVEVPGGGGGCGPVGAGGSPGEPGGGFELEIRNLRSE